MDVFTTPMMKQYQSIKKQYQDCLLFYRMGDFYELFLDDAYIGAKVLDITLTSRSKGKDGKIPMAGVPYHSVDPYIARLVKAGHKVAICEQVSEPSKYGIVEREVVRVITPGTLMDEHSLEKKENNFLISLSFHPSMLTIAACDISTGLIQVIEHRDNPTSALLDELARLKPAECILSPTDYENKELLSLLKTDKTISIFPFADWAAFEHHAYSTLKNHFGVATLEAFGIEEKPHAVIVTATLIGYLKHTQKDNIRHIRQIQLTSPESFMQLDRSTILNLELFSTLRDREIQGSLLSTIDYTNTAMGGRLLRQWLKHPLAHKEPIQERLDAVQELVTNTSLRQEIVKTLKRISDIERTISRLAVGIGNPRDLIQLKNSLTVASEIKTHLAPFHSSLIQQLSSSVSDQENLKVIRTIEQSILEEPSVTLKDGGIIRSNVDQKLDDLRKIIGSGKQWLLELETEEKKQTGISSLKIRFNKVFGFYIEVTNANLAAVPSYYIRKQTMVGGERFITPELKKKEEQILTAQEESNRIEYELFNQTVEKVLNAIVSIQKNAQALATIDVLIGFAILATAFHYTKPKLLYSGEIRIKQGRHPVVEQILRDTPFVPNDVTLNTTSPQLLLLTGPNMAGKSVLIRQVALIILLCQIGSFVPASQAHLSLVDKLFVRSGASDVITAGLSTFMVEMVETAYILNHATNKSLIIMDEIGRGTSTYDGISIAWAVAEFLVSQKNVHAKTLFATHYHELQALESEFPLKIKNMHMAVENDSDEPIFLHTLRSGGASHSFGIAVAKLAGIPESVIHTATQLLKELEQRDQSSQRQQASNAKNKENNVNMVSTLKKLDLSQTTPLQALNLLAQFQQEIKDKNNKSF